MMIGVGQTDEQVPLREPPDALEAELDRRNPVAIDSQRPIVGGHSTNAGAIAMPNPRPTPSWLVVSVLLALALAPPQADAQAPRPGPGQAAPGASRGLGLGPPRFNEAAASLKPEP
jgi:hypothetical protein